MKNKKNITISFLISFSVAILLSACANNPNKELQIEKSYLKGRSNSIEVTNAELVTSNPKQTLEQASQFRFVAPMKVNSLQAKSADDVLSQFSELKELKITADGLQLKDFLHQVLGEQLQVSYILGDEVKDDTQSVTLNLQDPISKRKLFTLTEELLTQRNYIIRFDDNIFYIHKKNDLSGNNDVLYGYGNQLTDIPQTSLEIVQMIPFEYGMQVSLGLTLRQLLGVKAIPDQNRNSMTIQGKRKDIIRALELIKIMDQPSYKNRQIGMYQSAFLSTKELIAKLTEILAQEGISAGKSSTLALAVVELDKQGQLIFFANNITVIERAVFWAQKIDKPILSADKQYFIYAPMYSRAIDMGESLEALIDGSGASLGNSTSAASENNGNSQSSVRTANSKDMKMVVDERANTLIFFATGEAYQQLLPLIKRLDVLPKQVMLEVVIAEVKLTDAFKSGVDFNLTNQGSASVAGGFNLGGSATGLSYVLTGVKGNVNINLFQSNDNVNVISRPSLLVRDGVTASITVGDDIPTVGSTVVDNGISTSSVIYRKTGIDLKVTPTINARGVVIMEIDQKISNQTDGGESVANSPVISERSISTEVIAESGQTIVLGGLISENSTVNDTRVPFFSSIPLLGKLFDTKGDTKDKTELVVLVTPRIIESSDEWNDIKAKFLASFSDLAVK